MWWDSESEGAHDQADLIYFTNRGSHLSEVTLQLIRHLIHIGYIQ